MLGIYLYITLWNEYGCTEAWLCIFRMVLITETIIGSIWNVVLCLFVFCDVFEIRRVENAYMEIIHVYKFTLANTHSWFQCSRAEIIEMYGLWRLYVVGVVVFISMAGKDGNDWFIIRNGEFKSFWFECFEYFGKWNTAEF